jgi:hypothetical protein
MKYEFKDKTYKNTSLVIEPTTNGDVYIAIKNYMVSPAHDVTSVLVEKKDIRRALRDYSKQEIRDLIRELKL